MAADAAVVAVVVVAGSKALFVAAAGTLLILVATLVWLLAASSLAALMDWGRLVFIAALVAVAVSNGRGVGLPAQAPHWHRSFLAWCSDTVFFLSSNSKKQSPWNLSPLSSGKGLTFRWTSCSTPADRAI
jgi:hypothetical protein